MSIFEYLMVLVSIVLGLGLTQTLRGLSKIARSNKRFSVVTLWAALLFVLHIQTWWAFWDLSSVPEWNQLYFFLLVLIPCSLFAATELLLPMNSSAETDWASHFWSVRRWLLATFSLFAALSILETRIFLDFPLAHPYRIFQGTILTLTLLGQFSTHKRVQFWIITAIILTLFLGQVAYRLLPGLR